MFDGNRFEGTLGIGISVCLMLCLLAAAAVKVIFITSASPPGKYLSPSKVAFEEMVANLVKLQMRPVITMDCLFTRSRTIYLDLPWQAKAAYKKVMISKFSNTLQHLAAHMCLTLRVGVSFCNSC